MPIAMKKLLYILIFPFILLSCNFKEDPKNTYEEIPTTKFGVLKTLAEEDPEVPRLLFSARGTEPGWFVQIYNDRLRLLVDYGKDSITIKNEFQNLKDSMGFGFTSYAKPDKKDTLLQLNVERLPCNDDATGEIKSGKVTVKYKNKIYKGCGEFEI